MNQHTTHTTHTTHTANPAQSLVALFATAESFDQMKTRNNPFLKTNPAPFGLVDVVNGQMVRSVLHAGAHANASTNEGKTGLHWAAGLGTKGALEAIGTLANVGADTNARNKDGDTPLHVAAKAGHVAAVVMLMELGASLEIRNNAGLTAADVAHPDVLVALAAIEADRLDGRLPEAVAIKVPARSRL